MVVIITISLRCYVIDYDSSPPSCNADELMAPNGTCVPECPEGTELDEEDWMCRVV